MNKQLTLGEGFESYMKTTKRAQFLSDMDRIIPWVELCDLIAPVYPVAGNGRPPRELEMMLRIYFLQQWFNLSDPAAEDALYDSLSMRRFISLDLGEERAPDETTICRFRHLLERNKLGEALFEYVIDYLEANGIKVGRGTIVDATIISAPPSTKNKEKRRDPDMHQTKKGNQWCASRTQAADLWCCTEDGSRPPEAGLQGQASNPPVLLRSKGAVVSDRAKVIP